MSPGRAPQREQATQAHTPRTGGAREHEPTGLSSPGLSTQTACPEEDPCGNRPAHSPLQSLSMTPRQRANSPFQQKCKRDRQPRPNAAATRPNWTAPATRRGTLSAARRARRATTRSSSRPTTWPSVSGPTTRKRASTGVRACRGSVRLPARDASRGALSSVGHPRSVREQGRRQGVHGRVARPRGPMCCGCSGFSRQRRTGCVRRRRC